MKKHRTWLIPCFGAIELICIITVLFLHLATVLLEKDEDDGHSNVSNSTADTIQSDYVARTKSLDRREAKKLKSSSSSTSKLKDKGFIITQVMLYTCRFCVSCMSHYWH